MGSLAGQGSLRQPSQAVVESWAKSGVRVTPASEPEPRPAGSGQGPWPRQGPGSPAPLQLQGCSGSPGSSGCSLAAAVTACCHVTGIKT
eukprot:70766-Rhodomonas_salina.2